MNQRILNIDGTLNFRDLGGYTTDTGQSVKWGAVYRSAQLDRLSSKGVSQLAALGVKTVVDLRFSDESNKYPTVAAAVPDAEMLSWHKEQESDSEEQSRNMIRSWSDSLDSKDPALVREAMRINYPQKLYTHRAIYRKMLLRLCEGRTPLIFHCAAGKDRTGVAAGLILSLLGVNDQQIIEDYLITQYEIAAHVNTWMAGGATNHNDLDDFQQNLARQPRELLTPIFDADITYIQTLLEYVKYSYDGFQGYSSEILGLDLDIIDTLRDRLLE